MQRPLVIFALGLLLLSAAGCAVQELPFTQTADSDVEPQASPYVPQPGSVYDGESGDAGYLGQNAGDGGFGTAPAGTGGVNTAPVQGAPTSHTPQPAYTPPPSYAPPPPGMPSQPKPLTTTPSGLKEREL